MNILSKLIIVLGSVAVCHGVAVQTPVPAEADIQKPYILPDGNSVQIEGVCRYDESQIQCLRLNGQASPMLSKRMEEHFSRRSSWPPNSDPRLDVSFGRKNRLVVFSFTGSALNLAQPNGGQEQLPWESGNPTLSWIQTALPANTPSVSMTLASSERLPEEKVDFSTGQKLSLGQETFTIVEVRPAPPTLKIRPQKGQKVYKDSRSYWIYHFRSEGPQPVSSGSYWLLDKQGDPIVFVDRRGAPVSPLTVAIESRQPPPGYEPQPPQKSGSHIQYGAPYSALANDKYAPGLLYPLDVKPPDEEFRSNVDPAYVGAIKFSGIRNFSVEFKDIPLDPPKHE